MSTSGQHRLPEAAEHYLLFVTQIGLGGRRKTERTFAAQSAERTASVRRGKYSLVLEWLPNAYAAS